MICVQCCLHYQLLRAIGSQYAFYYLCIKGVGILCYPISLYCLQKGDMWLSVYFHALLHFFANVANGVLYSGTVVALQDNSVVRTIGGWLLNG